MANFPTHVASGILLGGMLSTLAMATSAVTPSEVMTLTATCALGGVLPDVDLQNSRASRVMFSGLGVFIAFAVLFNVSITYSVAEMWLLWIATYVGVRYIGHALFHVIAVHRGVFHSLIAAAFAALLTTIVFTHLFGTTDTLAWLAGVCMFAGYLLHLVLDEIYSVDVMNERVKSSFGTALKLFDGDYPVASAAMAAAAVALFFASPSSEAFRSMFVSQETYSYLNERLLPEGKWFGVVPSLAELTGSTQASIASEVAQ